jgi:hypothetical protein
MTSPESRTQASHSLTRTSPPRLEAAAEILIFRQLKTAWMKNSIKVIFKMKVPLLQHTFGIMT